MLHDENQRSRSNQLRSSIVYTVGDGECQWGGKQQLPIGIRNSELGSAEELIRSDIPKRQARNQHRWSGHGP
jgi:hypothetical protein